MSTAPKQHKSMGASFLIFMLYIFFSLENVSGLFCCLFFVIYNTIKS